MDFNEARDDEVAVALAGPYANYLHMDHKTSCGDIEAFFVTGQMPFYCLQCFDAVGWMAGSPSGL